MSRIDIAIPILIFDQYKWSDTALLSNQDFCPIIHVGFGRLLLVKNPDWIKMLFSFETSPFDLSKIRIGQNLRLMVGLENVNLCHWLRRQIKLEEK